MRAVRAMGTRVKKALESLRTLLRPAFHWRYSGAFIPLFFATGIGMALANKFAMAYGFFALFGLWSLLYWLTSDTLADKRRELHTRAVRKDPDLLVSKLRQYLIYEWGGCLVIATIAASFLWWTYATKQQMERDDARDHLYSVPPNEDLDPMYTIFTIANGSGQTISRRHQIACLTNAAMGNHRELRLSGLFSGKGGDGTWWLSGGYEGARARYNSTLANSTIRPGGDAETSGCLSWLKFKEGTDCVDVDLIFWYTLESQPSVDQEKIFRYVTHRQANGTFKWYQNPVNDPQVHCEK
jgi:hypothetical protein